MRVRLATAAAILGLAFVGGLPADAPARPVATAAKTCRSGYAHAVIGGQEKCLHRGEYCAHRYQRQYKRDGFNCTHRDGQGRYHLT